MERSHTVNLTLSFGRLHALFQRVDKKAPFLFQYIALLLTFPCFEASHFFFKLAFFFQERRIALAGGENLLLQSDDRAVTSNRLTHAYEILRRIEHRLKPSNASEHVHHATLR
jgi:hypothetical protein